MKNLLLLLIVMGIFGCSSSDKIRKLYSLSEDISGKKFSYAQLEGLPEPVQGYFRNALPRGYPNISYVRLRHDGLFKTAPGKDWTDIEGEQYFTAEPPGFIWIGSTSMFRATDYYIGNEGRLKVKLLSFLTIVNEEGAEIDQGELLRWLGESLWFPTNLLQDDCKKWHPVDDSTAKLTFEHEKHSLYYIVHFNENDEIYKMETERYKDGELEKWTGYLSDYFRHDGVLIPGTIEAVWNLEEGDYQYARFHIKEIEYGIPREFE